MQRIFTVDSDTDDLIRSYVEHEVAVGGLSIATAEAGALAVRSLAHWLQQTGGPALADVGLLDIERWAIAQAERGLAASTRARRIHGLRSFFRWALPHADNPADRVRPPNVPPPVTRTYTVAETDHILAAAAGAGDLSGGFDHAVIATLRYTGLRASELTDLQLHAVDLSRRRIRVLGKGRKIRIVPMPTPLLGVVTDYLDHIRPRCPPSPYAFANPRCRPSSDRRGRLEKMPLRDLCRRWGDAAGVDGSHYPHRWRHTYATELLRSGTDLHVVQRVLGHANLETTTRYLHLLDTDLRAAIDLAFPPTTRTPPPSRHVPPRGGPWSRCEQPTLWTTEPVESR